MDLIKHFSYLQSDNNCILFDAGDISTMADGSVVQVLQDGHKELIAAAGGKK